MNFRAGLGALLVANLFACTATTAGAEQTPAVIASPTNESRTALRKAVQSLLGIPVTLADDALTRESTIVIDRTRARDPSGRIIDAQDTKAPETLRLVRRGSKCILIREATGQEAVLDDAQCTPVAP